MFVHVSNGGPYREGKVTQTEAVVRGDVRCWLDGVFPSVYYRSITKRVQSTFDKVTF